MGRKLEFSREKALHTAMESFWAKGYNHTSMRDLASSLGLHLGSVYNALGDKEKVFEAAMKLNFEEEILPKIRMLQESPHPMQAIDDMLHHVVNECTGEEPGPGCFMVNSLLEIASINDSISASLRGYLQQVEDMHAAVIEKGQKMGEISKEHDAHHYARYLIGVYFSMRTMAKLRMPHQYLNDLRDMAVATLKC
jgi:TetR/AcrR family transcriptional repressor of nem operon